MARGLGNRSNPGAAGILLADHEYRRRGIGEGLRFFATEVTVICISWARPMSRYLLSPSAAVDGAGLITCSASTAWAEV